MGEKIEIQIAPDGTMEAVYSDKLKELAKSIGADISMVCRASNVEWEVVEKPLNARFPATSGWSVRAAHDPTLALRYSSSLNPGVGERYLDFIECSRNEHNAIVLFDKREDALMEELKHFWQLLPKKEGK